MFFGLVIETAKNIFRNILVDKLYNNNNIIKYRNNYITSYSLSNFSDKKRIILASQNLKINNYMGTLEKGSILRTVRFRDNPFNQNILYTA